MFNNQYFALELRFKSLVLLSHSHNNVFSYGVSFFRSSILLFLFLAVLLILKLPSLKHGWQHSLILLLLSGDGESIEDHYAILAKFFQSKQYICS